MRWPLHACFRAGESCLWNYVLFGKLHCQLVPSHTTEGTHSAWYAIKVNHAVKLLASASCFYLNNFGHKWRNWTCMHELHELHAEMHAEATVLLLQTTDISCKLLRGKTPQCYGERLWPILAMWREKASGKGCQHSIAHGAFWYSANRAAIATVCILLSDILTKQLKRQKRA